MVTTRLRRLSVFLAVTLPLYIWFLRNLFAKVGHVAKKCSFSNSITEVNRGPNRSQDDVNASIHHCFPESP